MKKKHLVMKNLFLLIALLIFSINRVTGQTPGMIYEPATGGGRAILDPNNDGYTSASTAGFIANDAFESELPYVRLVFPSFEPNSDLGPGPNCGFTDFVDQPNQDPCQNYLDAGNNWLYRFRMGGTSPNSKSYSVLIDIDQKFGSTGSNADPNYTVGNPGFEIELVLATNFGVYIYDVDGKNTSNPPVLVKSYLGHSNYQKSIALTMTCGDPDYFYDFYIPFSDLTTYFGITTSTPLRFAIIDNMAATASAIGQPSSLSDLGGVDDAACGGSYDNCFVSVIDNYTPCGASTFPCPDRSACPGIIGPIGSGISLVQGTSIEADGTIITIFKNGISIGTTTVTAGSWTFSGFLPVLAGGDIIEASATAPDKGESFKDCSQKIVDVVCSANPTSATHCGKSIQGIAPVAGARINIYQGSSTTPVIPGGGTVFIVGTPNTVTVTTLPSSLSPSTQNFLFKCTTDGASTSCNSSGPACLINGAYRITATEPGKCESPGLWMCVGGNSATGNPTITTNPVLITSTSISGAVSSPDNVAGVAVFLYSNGAQIGTATTIAGGVWTISGLSLSGRVCETLSVVAIRTATNLCPSIGTVTKIVQRKAYPPVINGPLCSLSAITSISGTSVEVAGTTIEVFEGAVSKGTTTVAAGGTWTKSSISIALGSTVTAKAYSTCLATSDASTGIVVGTKSTNAVAITTSPIYECGASVSGTGTDGDIITLFEDGFQIGSTTTVAGGTWTISGLNTNCFLYANGIVTATAASPGKCEGNISGSVTVVCVPPSGSLAVTPANTAICSGTTASVTVESSESGVVYQLYNGAATSGSSKVGTAGSLTLTSAFLTSSATLTVKAFRIGTSCQATLANTVAVTVNSGPTASVLAGSADVCSGSAANLTVTITGGVSPYNVSINNSVGTTNNYISGSNISVTPISTTTFGLISVTDANSCASIGLSGTPTVNVTATPSNNPVLTVDASLVCFGTNTNINVPTMNDGYTYQLKKQSDNSILGTSFTGDGTTYSRSTGSLTSSEIFYVMISNGLCSHIGTNVINVNIAAIPATPTITTGGPTTFCTGGSVTLTSSSATGNSWSNGETTESITVSTAGTYTVSVTSSGCTSPASDGITVTVNPIPSKPTISAGGPTTFCTGGSVTLTSSSATGNSWSNGEITQSITVSTAGTYTVSVTVSGCTSPVTDGITVIINPESVGGTIAGSAIICSETNSTVLTLSGFTGNINKWQSSIDGGANWSDLANTTNSYSAINISQTTIFRVEVKSGSCSSSFSATANITAETEWPIIDCPIDMTRITDPGQCTYTVSGTEFDPIYSDNCPGATISNDLNGGNSLVGVVLPKGTTGVTWSVTDGFSHTASCIFYVTVNNPAAEGGTLAGSTIVCSETNSTLLTLTGYVGTISKWQSSIDGGGNWIDISNTNSTYTVANISQTTIFRVVVESGTCSTVYSTIAAISTDTQLPEISCVADQTRSSDLGECSYTVSGTEFDPGYSDNCSGATIINNFNNSYTLAGAVFPSASTMVIWTVTDIEGSVAACSFNVTVTDDQSPTLTCPEDIIVEADAGLCTASSVALGIAVTGDNCSVASVTNDAPALFPMGNTTVIWTVTDGSSKIATCEQAVNVVSRPVAVYEKFIIDEDASVTSDVLLNDTDCDGNIDPTSVTITTNPSHGTVSVNPVTGAITYTPTADFNGTDSYIYQVCDNGTPALCDTAIVHITITPVNNGPIANVDYPTTSEDSPVTTDVVSNDTDLDGTIDPTSVTITTNPSHGTVAVNPVTGAVTYTPNPNFNGTDSYIYQVCDNGTPVLCDTAIVHITILSVNDIPVVFNENEITCNNSAFVGNIIANGDYDPDGTGLTVNITPVVSPANGVFSILANGDYVYTPSITFAGIDTIVLSVCDNGIPLPAGCTNDTITITVIPSVVMTAGSDTTVCKATGSYVLGSARAVNFSSVLWTSSGSGTFDDPGLVNPVYTPGTEEFSAGKAVLTMQISGLTPCSEITDSLILTFSPAPVVNAGSDVTICNSAVYIFNDASAFNYSSLLWEINPVNAGTLSDATILKPIYTPAAGFTGNVTLTLKAFGSPVCSLEVANHQMVLTVVTGITVNAGINQVVTTGEVTTLQGSATGGSGIYEWTWEPSALLLSNNTPHPGTLPVNKQTLFTATVVDVISGCSAQGEMVVSIAVVAQADYDSTLINTATTIHILNNDSDAGGDARSVSICGDPAHGVVVINQDNTITYTPDGKFIGNDKFCYMICNNGDPLLCDTATVFVHVIAKLDDLVIYNLLTPDGDNSNDTWYILGIEDFPDNTILVFNRWGDRVRDFDRYDNKDIFWDGTNKKGEILPSGTYYYILTIKDVGSRTGWIYLHGSDE